MWSFLTSPYDQGATNGAIIFALFAMLVTGVLLGLWIKDR